MGTIRFQCPHCQKEIQGEDTLYGQKTECPHCKGVLTVPQRPEAPPKMATLLPEPPDAEGDKAQQTAEREMELFRVHPVTRAYLGRVTLAILLVVVSVGLAVGLNWDHRAWFLLLLIAPFVLAVQVWLRTKSTTFRLTNERFFIETGLVARKIEEVELFRVQDVTLEQTLMERVLGIGTLFIISSDQSIPKIEVKGVKNPVEIKEKLRTAYRNSRRSERVRSSEFIQS